MNDFNIDDPEKPEGPLPFWLKAAAIVMGIPFINSVIPGSVVWLATLVGLPDPASRREEPPKPQYGQRDVTGKFLQRNP